MTPKEHVMVRRVDRVLKATFHRKWLLAVFALVPLCGIGARAEEPRYFAIRHARIVPVSGPEIKSGTVVIAKGLIVAVGENVSIPPEAWVIEGKGLTVYPGFINALSDLGLGPPPAAPGPAGGGGGAARGQPQQPQPVSHGPQDRPASTPWMNAADELKPDDKRVETWRNAGFTSTLAAPMTGILPGQGAVVNLAGERPGEMVVAAPSALLITLQPLRGFGNFPDSLMGVISYVRQVFLDANWYNQSESIYRAHPAGLERPAYDRTEIVVNDALASGRAVLLPGNTAQEMHRVLLLADRLGARAVIYGGQQGYEDADELAAAKLPVLVNLKWPEKEKDADPEAEEPLRVLRFRDRAPSSPAALQKAGVKFAFYFEGIGAPKDALKNAKKAVDAGLAADAALRAFTLNAAEILGVGDRLGSIEPGKIANLVVTDGDIFNEKTKVKMTFVDGRRYEVREPGRPTAPPTVKLAGKWKISLTGAQGPEEATADLSMEPDGTLAGSLTGVSGAMVGSMGTVSIRDGWVSGNQFSFTLSLTFGGSPIDVIFSGTLEGEQMKGIASGGGASVDFTGSRPSSTAATVNTHQEVE
jgi:imidazolonepropionase-like amidohydrolase